ncbi:MAG: tetratricopeptide repeat protein [Saprospiraceae bacterium]
MTRRKQALYVGMGNTSKATKELEKLVEAFPQNTNYKHILAAYLMQIDEKGKAEKVYESILKIDSNDAQAQLALKGGSKPSSDIDNFVAGLKPIFSNKEVGIDAKVKQIIPQIQMVANTGNKALATGLLELTQDLETAHPDEPKVYAIAGDLYFYTKDYENAKNKYAKALELDKSIYLVWEQYLISLEELEDYEMLAQRSSDALDLFPNQGMLYYLNGLALRETGDNSSAIISLNQAKMMSGRIPHILYGVQIELGKAYHASNRYEKSDEAFKAALEMNAKDPFLLKTYAERLLERGEYPEKAKEMAELANSLQPSNPDMESLMGWTFYQEGNYNKAIEWLNKAYNQKQDAEIAERLGDAYFQSGKSEEALKYWQIALDKNKDNKKLQQKIKDKALPK